MVNIVHNRSALARLASLNLLPTLLVLAVGVLAFSLGCSESPAEDTPIPDVAESPPAEYAQELVQEAVDRYNIDGREATVDYYNSNESMDGEWHVFILDEEGYIIALAAFPSWVGVHDSEFKGPNDYPVGQMVIDSATEEGVQIDYLFDESFGRGLRSVWSVKHDGLIFGSSSWSGGARQKSDQPVYTQEYVQQAISLYEASGLDAALEYYSDPVSVDGQWYAFIVDTESGRTIGHFNPDLRNRDPSLRVDSTGYFYGDDLLGATETGSWIQYVITNPDSGEEQLKHAWAVLHDGYIFASGWYE